MKHPPSGYFIPKMVRTTHLGKETLLVIVDVERTCFYQKVRRFQTDLSLHRRCCWNKHSVGEFDALGTFNHSLSLWIFCGYVFCQLFFHLIISTLIPEFFGWIPEHTFQHKRSKRFQKWNCAFKIVVASNLQLLINCLVLLHI